MTDDAPSRRDMLALLGGAGLGIGIWPTVTQADQQNDTLRYGWDPNIEGPATADLHVAQDGNDRNPGTLAQPLRTVQAGVDRLAALGRGSLAIHAGLYREQISLDALRGHPNPQGRVPFRIYRFGRDHVTITAADTATGWQRATSREVEPLGISSEGVYFLDIADDTVRHGDAFSLNLHENGIWCPLARRAAATAASAAIFDHNHFLSGVFTAKGPKQLIHAIQSDDLIGVERSQVLQTQFQIYAAPNIVGTASPRDFDPVSGTAYFPETLNLRLQVTGKKPQMLFAVQNLPAQLKPGEWAFHRHEGAIRLFFHPRNRSSLEHSVEISVRGTCLDLGRATGLEIFGLEVIRAAGAGRLGGICIRREAQPGQTEAVDLRLAHCRIGENLCSTGNGYGAIFLAGVSELAMQSCTVGPSQGSFGLFLNGCSKADMRFLLVTEISKSPCRFYGLKDSILAFSRFEDSGWDAHANKFNFYTGSDRILVYGIKTHNTGGYATYQRASRIFFGFCELDCDPESQNRALVSQNIGIERSKARPGGTGEPASGGRFIYWNLSLLPQPRHPTPANSLSLGPGDSTQRHAVHNCILHGGGLGDVYLRGANPELEQRSHNVYTGFAHWQSARYGWSLGVNEQTGRGRGTLSGFDMRDMIITQIAPFFPAFQDWDKDIEGRQIDWANAPIGARR